ncbi:MAG: PLP-dependent aminotransferase family protein [Candidatus Delongbacteria bacterium]|nr:PLP-dependent aminotransferase family protein [Candidatus Delongbacteria bacterium]MCG2761316.1 PLP-dependent aminotransferase family protein [Candidatus Delongbacteria bacterium]
MINNWNERFSENTKKYEGYPIGKTLKLLAGNPDIISLAGGLPSPDVFQKSEVRIATEKILAGDNINQIMQYSSIPGERSLFDGIIKFLKRDNINVSEENILVTTSGQHGLDLTGRLFLNPGDTVLLDRPTFAGAVVAFDLNRPKYIGVDIQEDGSDVNGFRAKLLEIQKSGGKMPKFIYVVPDFQNPTGISMSLEKREALLDLSYEFHIPVIEDSPYKDLRYYGEMMPSIYSLDQKREGTNVIGLYTFSKIFCPGMRVGFNIGPAEVITRMCNIKEGNILNTPKYNQDVCAAFLNDMGLEKHFENCRNYYREKLNLFLDTMAENFPEGSGVSWTKPEGGLFLWATVPEHIDTEKLFYEAIKYKVAFVPGWQFYGENPSNNHMRLNFSYSSKDQLKEAIKRLAKCIKDQM